MARYKLNPADAREALAQEVERRATVLAFGGALADRIRALPDDDPRLVDITTRGGYTVLDMLDDEEWKSAIEPYRS